jgi:hypothetical protein
MHVRFCGDPLEITNEMNRLTISCDFSGCTHATTHTLDVPMRNVQPRDSFIARISINRDCAEETGCLEAVN